MASPDKEDVSYITKQAFMNVSGSIPNSLQSSENSLSSSTPTIKRSAESVASSHSKRNSSGVGTGTNNNNNNNNNNGSNEAFDLNNKHLSITLSCHSSESAGSSNNEINKIVEEMYKEDDGGGGDGNGNGDGNGDVDPSMAAQDSPSKANEKSGGKNSDKKRDKDKDKEKDKEKDKDSKGTKKFGFKHIKNTISKTFSKASFHKFSISHRKGTVNSTNADGLADPNLGFTSKEEQEEFNNFINNLNTKKGNSKQRPSLTGLFLTQEPSTHPDSLSPNTPKSTVSEPLPRTAQARKKSIENANYEAALRRLCEALEYEEPMVLAKYLKKANGDENLALKNYLKDSEAATGTVKEHNSTTTNNNKTSDDNEPMAKDAPLEMNELNNIEKNSIKQAPIIIKGRKSK